MGSSGQCACRGERDQRSEHAERRLRQGRPGRRAEQGHADPVRRESPIAVPAGGIDIAGTHGTLHINPDGSYSYQRTLVWVGDVTPGSTDVFTYTLADNNGASSSTSLTIEVLPETIAAPDSKGVHKGTAFDDYIIGDNYSVEQSDDRVAFDGGDGQDMIDAGEAGASRIARRRRQRLPDRQQPR